jgi:hypothetical protein
MSRCIHYVGLSSLREILRDPAHGVVLAYTASPRVTFGELSCSHVTAGTKRPSLGLGKPDPLDTCWARFYPDMVDLL